jgi:peptide-methionine (S)-S-oxide reductase
LHEFGFVEICEGVMTWPRGGKRRIEMNHLRLSRWSIAAVAACVSLIGFTGCGAAGAKGKVAIADPAVDDSLAKTKGQQTVVLSGGCFWGIQLVFEHVKGVVRATAGYSGGSAKAAEYEIVSTGTSGHAESVEVVYDPSVITFGQLLKVFFSVAHDPTELNRQGPDTGTQYRSAIFYSSEDQKRIAEAYISQLDGAKSFGSPIVTKVTALQAFYPAEGYHQDYAAHNPDDPYIAFNDLPKLAHLREQLPELYVAGK